MLISENMKKCNWLIACFFVLTVNAQEKLVIVGKAPDMHVVHMANGTESLQNISNQFGQSVSKLSKYNRININTAAALPKGTAVKIPLTKDNLLQQPAEGSGPVYHVIKKGDNLYRLSQVYNKVPIASMKEWNNMKKDIVKNGQYVIIGYMVNASNNSSATSKKQEVKAETSEVSVSETAVPAVVVPEKKMPVKKEPVKKPVTVDLPKAIDGGLVEVKETKPVVEVKKPVEAAPVKKETTPTSSEYTPKEGDEGFFANSYSEHPKEQTQQFHSGDAATFKSISGWTDRKYYVLMNDIAPKTIVRITGTSNKSICAMVLGPLQETKGGTGLLLRVSNSAASALGINDSKFMVTVTYFE